MWSNRYVCLADERQLEPLSVEVAIEPRERLGALARIEGPAGRDDPDLPAVEGLALRRSVEDRRVDGVRDDDGVAELEAELAVLLEAVARLEDGRVRQLAVQLHEPRVGAVVETAIGADRTVHTVDQPALVACEASESREVEVEGVEETGGRAAGHPVLLDVETTALELESKRPQELMASAGRRRLEVVEEREIGPAPTRGEPVGLGAHSRTSSARPGAPPAEPCAGPRRTK